MAVWEPPQDLFWFKSVGAAEWPMEEDWFENHPNETELIHFSKQPTSVRTSHPLLYYAAGHQKIFGIVEVSMKAERDPQREGDPRLERWVWGAPVRPEVIIKSFDRAPSLDVLSDVEPDRDWHKFVQQMDYHAISQDVFNHAARLLVETADPSQGDILDRSFAAEHGRRLE